MLAAFAPRVAGTPPLGLELPGSDIDVLCFAPDAHAFAAAIWQGFRDAPEFTARQGVDLPRSVVASFKAAGWRIELYGEAIPVERQRGWRHFEVERQLLALGGANLKQAVLERRRRGMKTEPAFAMLLGLTGDPYLALLALGEGGDDNVVSALRAAGFTGLRCHEPHNATWHGQKMLKASANFCQPLAKHRSGRIDRFLLGQVREVGACRQAGLGKRCHQPPSRKIIADQCRRSHRDTKPVNRSLNGQVKVIQRQRRRRVQSHVSGQRQPITPEFRHGADVQQRMSLQVGDGGQGKPHNKAGAAHRQPALVHDGS